MNKLELINTSSNIFFEVDSEEYRVYQFKEGDCVTEIRIDYPAYVAVNPTNGGHRILDATGISHYIQPGWKHLYWKAKEGQAHFKK